MWSATPSLGWQGVVPAASTHGMLPLACSDCSASQNRADYSQHRSKMSCAALFMATCVARSADKSATPTVHAVEASFSPEGIV